MQIVLKSLSLTVAERLSAAWRDALACAVAAVLSWELAVHLFGHPQPLFAAISAIVCLSPSLPSHGRQAIGLLIGVATGIVVGELALFLPDGVPLFRLGLAAFIAIIVASTYGLSAVVPIQAGVSAILVLAVGPANAGSVRMLDVATGAAVGLFFSQVVLTPDPVRMVDAAARDLLSNLAAGFTRCAEALRERDPKKGEAALHSLSGAHDSVIALGSGIVTARNSARWSLRGRLVARQVDEIAARYDRHAIRLYASALLFGESVADALRKGATPVPDGLLAHVERVAGRCAEISNGQNMQERLPDGEDLPLVDEPAPPEWRSTVEHLHLVEQALAAFRIFPER